MTILQLYILQRDLIKVYYKILDVIKEFFNKIAYRLERRQKLIIVDYIVKKYKVDYTVTHCPECGRPELRLWVTGTDDERWTKAESIEADVRERFGTGYCCGKDIVLKMIPFESVYPIEERSETYQQKSTRKDI